VAPGGGAAGTIVVAVAGIVVATVTYLLSRRNPGGLSSIISGSVGFSLFSGTSRRYNGTRHRGRSR
jgi:multisubunit Na+/H+ antiporter MnhB subunit